MALEAEVYNALTTSTTLTAIVGDRIYPLCMIQGAGYPAVVYRRHQGERYYTMGGYTGLENPSLQVEIHATAITARRVTGDAVIGAISSATAFRAIVIASPIDLYDDEVEVYTRTYDVDVWFGT